MADADVNSAPVQGSTSSLNTMNAVDLASVAASFLVPSMLAFDAVLLRVFNVALVFVLLLLVSLN
jgi:hypothetical protein